MKSGREFAKHLIFALFLISITLLVLRFFQPLFWLVLFPDDGFYYLRIAQNMALGLGPSFDGINPTNGYHPLWMLFLVLLAAFVKNPYSLALAALILQIFLASAGFGFLGLSFSETGGGKKGFWLMAAFVFLNPVLVSIFVNGLESALYFMLLSLSFWLWVRISNRPPRTFWTWLGLGIFLGLVFWARLDGGLLAGWLVLALLLSDGPGAQKIKKIFSFGLGFVLLAAPYLFYNFAEFGHPVPVSGRIKAFYMSHNPGYLLGIVTLFLAALAMTFVFHLRGRGNRSSFSKTLFSFTEFALSVVFYYLLSPVYALNLWYYLPVVLVCLLAFGRLFAILLESRSRAATMALGVYAAAGVCAIAAGFFIYLYPPANSVFKTQAKVADWIKEHTPKDSLLAAWSSGAVAYFSERQTVNLDGLVNSPDYFFNYRIKGKRDEFMRKMRVNYIVVYYNYDAPPPIDKFSFPVKPVYEQKAAYRGPATLFQPSTVSYFILQTSLLRP